MNRPFLKILGVFSLLLVFSLFTSAQDKGIQNKRITIDRDNITLNEFLSEIRQQTGYDFVFTSSKLDFNQRISPKFHDASVVEVLSHYFNPASGVIHIFKNQTIVLLDEDKAEYKILQGRVVDEASKQALSGVTICIAEKKEIHTRTDKSGNFVLNVPEYAHVLEASYVGYEKKVTLITASVKYAIELQQKTEKIEDVVVTGIFNRNADSFTGSSTTISGDDIRKINTNSALSAISAVDPSFRLVTNNATGSDLNQLPQVQMRGENSFPNLSGQLSNNPNEPLFILDGFQVNLQRIVDLDMNLIHSITLLKDASATAIYGSRGANGVFVVKTLPPAPGKIQITFSNDFRLNVPNLGVYDLLNASEKMDFEERVGIYRDTREIWQYQKNVLKNERYKNTLRGIDTDWKKLPTQVGSSNRSSLRFQGGDHIFRYGVQFTADLQEGVMKGQDRDNYSGQIDLSYQLEKLRFINSTRIIQNNANVSPFGSFSQYLSMNPYYSPYDENGNMVQFLEDITFHPDYQPNRVANPMYNTMLNSVNSSNYFGVSNNFSIRYDILPFLFLESNLSINKQLDKSDQFFSAQDTRFADVELSRRGSYTARNGETFSIENLSTANFNLRLGKHQVLSTLGFNTISNKNEYYSITAEGFPYDRLDNLLFAQQYQQNGRPTGDESTVRSVGFVYNGMYSFDNRFLADISIRQDGSSQYGSERKFGTFWSGGVGWNIHNEEIFKNSTFVNRLRLRSNYGVTGSMGLPSYASQFRYNFGNSSSYYDELGAVLISLGNKNLSWQSVYKWNIGMDIVLMDERLDMRLETYRENTKNAIATITLAPSTGFPSFVENQGELLNKGFEFSAKYVILKNPAKGLLWSVNVNGFTNSNILKKLSNSLKNANEDLESANSSQIVPNVLLQEGMSMNTIFAVRSNGVDPATGAEIFVKRNGELTYEWDAADKVAVGINQPKWNGNFGSSLMYKGVEVNLIFNYQTGGQLYNQTLVDRVENVNANQNVDRRAYELGWTQPGDIAQYKRITANPVMTRVTSRFVQDDNNLRLASASLGYNFYGKPFLKRLGLNGLSITALTNDPLWFSSINIERGTDNPFARNYSFSIRASF